MKYFYDLHIHSCVSPCGDMDMTPNNIVNMAIINELDIIAVSDHNTAANLKSVFEVAKNTPLLVIPAIEVCTSEEVHVLCLFKKLDSCLKFSDYLYSCLPCIENQVKIFGEQAILNENDEQIGCIPNLLINATTISIDKLISLMPEYDGLAIPAHIDRSSYSILSNLGFIHDDLYIPCVEIKNPDTFVFNANKNIISNSDAHYLENMHSSANANFIELESLSIDALFDVLKKQKAK